MGKRTGVIDRRALIRTLQLATVTLAIGASPAQERTEESPTNLSLLQALSSSIGAAVADSVGISAGDSIRVEFQPAENTWLLEEGVLQGLNSRSLLPTRSTTARFAARVMLQSSSVRYSDLRTDGFLGSRIMDRTVSLVLTVRVTRQESGQFEIARTFERSVRDTVAYADMERLEQPSTPLTRGDPPPEGFFASVMEPLVLICALGVAVLLLFTVRS